MKILLTNLWINIYVNKLSLCLANSLETKVQLLQNGVSSNNIYLFPNSVDFNYFKYLNNDKKSIFKIICVSNHPPPEILALEKHVLILGISINFFGLKHKNRQLRS